MQKDNLLVEIGTEELPPKLLPALGDNFAQLLGKTCKESGFDYQQSHAFITPRRIAARLEGLVATQANQLIERKGPLVSQAYDKSGKPLPAAIGFAKSCNVEIEDLQLTDDQQRLYVKRKLAGQHIKDCLEDLLVRVLDELSAGKRMRWGDTPYEFPRPVRWIVTLYGNELIKLSLMGINSDRVTYGHLYHCHSALTLASADVYEEVLEQHGKVIPSFDRRMQRIQKQLSRVATCGATQIDEALLEEVTAIVEWPVAVSGQFNQNFLELPATVISKVLQTEQKSFVVTKKDGSLAAEFITVANIESNDQHSLRLGYQRVVHPRLEDARFFITQDRKYNLEHYASKLDGLVFHQRLGTMADKVTRLTQLSALIADRMNTIGIKTNQKTVARAAHLSKADLSTRMVREYGELTGFLGAYYAQLDGESATVCKAIEQYLMPVRARDTVPKEPVAIALAIADRVDTLVGIFGIGELTSGSRDPYALRRNSLALIRIIDENNIDLDAEEWVAESRKIYHEQIDEEGVAKLLDYLVERLKHYFIDHKFTSGEVEAVSAIRPLRICDVRERLLRMREFMQLPQTTELAEATKRIRNILRKNTGERVDAMKPEQLHADAEQQLYQSFCERREQVDQLIQDENYLDALKVLAQLRKPIAKFFDEVMVMSENANERHNRLALLHAIDGLFIRIADFSKLNLEEGS